jgi:hypothetical protein
MHRSPRLRRPQVMREALCAGNGGAVITRTSSEWRGNGRSRSPELAAADEKLSRDDLSVGFLCACGASPPEPVALTTELTETAGSRTPVLSHTPSEVLRGGERTQVAPDLVLGGGPDGFAYIVDVTAVGGKMFVLDGLAHQVRVFDAIGGETGQFGRRGEGPGEFRTPIAIVAVGDELVTWQSPKSRALAVWNLERGLLASGAAPIDGDWDNGSSRKPVLIGPINTGPEDQRQRLRAAGGHHFIHEVHPDEEVFRRAGEPYPYEVPPAHLVRYNLNLEIIDTVSVLAGAELEIIEEEILIRGTDRVEFLPFAHERYYASRPVWATGADWLAVGHGDSTKVVVRRFDGEPLLDIRWPARRREVREEDMREAAKWMLAYQILQASNSRESFEGLSRKEIEEGINVTAFEWTKWQCRR